MAKSQLTLAIDPGERVGWAKGIVGPTAGDFTVVERGVHPLRDFALKLGDVIGNYDTVVYESWRLYPGIAKTMIGNDMQPSQLVGMIRYLGWTHPTVKMVVQGASIKNTALKTMPSDLKESLALSTEQHDQDAIMHLWYYNWKEVVAK